MEIPKNFNSEILANSETAMLWLAIETMRFVEDTDSEIKIDPDTDKYMRALSYALISSIGDFIDHGVIKDQRGMVDMLASGVPALMGMGYVLGYQAAKIETTK
jgi:hypothetical protein